MVLTIAIGNIQGEKMTKERIIRSGRRIIGKFLDDGTTFQIRNTKSNVKGGNVTLPSQLFHEEIAGKANKLTLMMGEKKAYQTPLVSYWLSVHEFLAYATKIRGQYVVSLYNFKSRRI